MSAVPSPVKQLAESWRARVKERRALTLVDPAADALERAASELDAAIAESQSESRLVGSVEFARARGVLPSTVRKWCARGDIPGAVKNDAGDWEIPVNARRAPHARKRA